MKNILLIGVGGTGSAAVDILFKKIQELGSQTNNFVTALVFDTDKGDIESIKSAKAIPMADNASVGTICDRIGRKYIREWFPCDDKSVRNQEMVRGASQWRKKSYLAFLNLMNNSIKRKTFTDALENMVADPAGACEVYVITSIAGGTGSGSFIPITLFAKRYLRKTLGIEPQVRAMLALPDIFADKQTPENRIKVYANAYAILREINAINLVARDYNNGHSTKKNAAIEFKIGNENEPNVGVLFDSNDPSFWTPTAAPFNQIFVLDKIPGIDSVPAHNIVLANSLYSIICTEIGVKFDSEASNHEILHAQNNGSNSIFSSISSSQVKFPLDSILSYLAHEKTLETCDKEWLTIHEATNKKIRELEAEQREMGHRLTLNSLDYANYLLLEAKNITDADPRGTVAGIIERGTAIFDPKTHKKNKKSTAEMYVEELLAQLEEKIPSADEFYTANIDSENAMTKESIKGDKEGAISQFEDAVGVAKEHVCSYFEKCVDTLRRYQTNLYEQNIALVNKKLEENEKLENVLATEYKLVHDVLQKDGKYVHPVAAMVQLCRVKVAIAENYNPDDKKPWSSIKHDISIYPESDLSLTQNKDNKKSFYSSYENRFESATKDSEGFLEDYREAKTRYLDDYKTLMNDIKVADEKIEADAKKQLKDIILSKIDADVDVLIAKYRAFFDRFEKEKDSLKEKRESALKKDSQSTGSVINVFSSVEDKEHLRNEIFKKAGPASDAELRDTDAVVGGAAFATVYNMACATRSENGTKFNDKDSKPYRALFDGMIESYENSIQQADAFKQLADYNVVQAIWENAKNADDGFAALADTFSSALTLAQPSLKLYDFGDETNLVRPSEIVVFMLSHDTAHYIKLHAAEFKLKAIEQDASDEELIKSCTEEFILKFSGYDKARVAIVKSLPNFVVYCTGEIMDISPLYVPKFDELSDDKDNIYFLNYQKAIRNFKLYDTDMWNPHLGNNLYKRGYLPYMNEKMEEICDHKMVKALLYGFMKEYITYEPSRQAKNNYYFTCTKLDGEKEIIKGKDGLSVSDKNIAQLLEWVRNEDDIVDEWSRLFDNDIEKIKLNLPTVSTDNEIPKLKDAITRSSFIKCLNSSLYVNRKNNRNVSLLEFAYKIKTSEEIIHDNDDAERILDVANETFIDIIQFKLSNSFDKFSEIYKHELSLCYQSLATSETVMSTGKDCEDFMKNLVAWICNAGFFKDIPENLKEDSKSFFAEVFDFKKDPQVMNCLNSTKKAAKEKQDADEQAEAAKEAQKRAELEKEEYEKKIDAVKDNSNVSRPNAKKALEEAGGDYEKALAIAKEKYQKK